MQTFLLPVNDQQPTVVDYGKGFLLRGGSAVRSEVSQQDFGSALLHHILSDVQNLTKTTSKLNKSCSLKPGSFIKTASFALVHFSHCLSDWRTDTGEREHRTRDRYFYDGAVNSSVSLQWKSKFSSRASVHHPDPLACIRIGLTN